MIKSVGKLLHSLSSQSNKDFNLSPTARSRLQQNMQAVVQHYQNIGLVSDTSYHVIRLTFRLYWYYLAINLNE